MRCSSPRRSPVTLRGTQTVPFALRSMLSFLQLLCAILSNALKICLRRGSRTLWRRLEKSADNLLKGVDQICNSWTRQRLGDLFSEILTNRHLGSSSVNQMRDWSSRGIHRFTTPITTPRLYFLKSSQ